MFSCYHDDYPCRDAADHMDRVERESDPYGFAAYAAFVQSGRKAMWSPEELEARERALDACGLLVAHTHATDEVWCDRCDATAWVTVDMVDGSTVARCRRHVPLAR